MGLGLAIVRHLVEMHGGNVSASSPGKNKGSTFTVRLPAASTVLPDRPKVRAESEAKPPVEVARPEEGRRLRGVRLLVVEDDPDTLDLLRFILDNRGAEVMTAASTAQALKALEHWRPNILVSDLAMPGEDGYVLIGRVRSRGPEQGGDIPAVALSAYTRNEDRNRALAAGFQMHLPKPVDPEELISVVANLTGHAQDH